MESVILKAKDITPIVENELCLSCGACSTVCPTNVITYHETIGGHIFPKIDYEGCIDCVKCADVCPGINFNQTLNDNMPEDPFIGEIIEQYVGKATDNDLYLNSQSGGVSSAVILYALEHKIIDVAIMASMQEGVDPRGMGILVRTKKDLLKSQKSKYCPIPLLDTLNEIKKTDLKYAIVGLSCHIHGLNNILETKKRLKRNLQFTIGLICDRVMTYGALDFLVDKTDIPKETIKNFVFRDKSYKGYPGHINISTKKSTVYYDSSERGRIKDFFTPARCRLCFDKMNVYSDITIGDPHGLPNIDRKDGESLVIVRSLKGSNLIKEILAKNYSTLRKIDSKEKMIQGQHISTKRKEWKGYVENWKEINGYLPSYYSKIESNITFKDNAKYKKNLLQSLSLNKYETKKDILNTLKKIQKKEYFKSKFIYPLQMLKHIISLIIRRN